MDAPDTRDRASSDGPSRHARLLATAGRMRAEAGPQELLETVAEGLLRPDPGVRLCLHLAAGDGTHVVAAVPVDSHGCDDAATTLHRAMSAGHTVVSETDGTQVATPLVVEGRTRGALVVHGASCPSPARIEDLELAAVLLAGAVMTVRRLEEQRDLDRVRSNFVARISHELRTPLTIISGFATTLGAQEDLLSVEQRHGMLDRIVTASVRLEHLVEEVLTLASVDLGHTIPDPVPCLVRDVLDLVVHDQGGEDRCTVTCAGDLRLTTDPVIARLVLGPIVENALEHGDRVELEGRATPTGVTVTVTDDGPGIPADLGDAIFERFVRGHDRSPGFGLGLSTAREVGATIGAVLSVVAHTTGARVAVDLPDLEDASR